MKDFIKIWIVAFIAGGIYAAYDHHRETQTIGVSMSYIQSAKADCERGGKKCVMLWDFMEVENDYEQ